MSEPGSVLRNFDTCVQSIASAAHLRGVVLIHRERVEGTIEGGAAELCRTLRTAHEKTRSSEHDHDHVVRLTAGIVNRLGPKGSVEVSRTAWQFLQGYANRGARRTVDA